MMTEYGQVKQIISTLEHEFTLSSNPNSRKGGLVGLAATAIALGRVSGVVSVEEGEEERGEGEREGGREGEREREERGQSNKSSVHNLR